MPTTVYLGADHAGLALKNSLREHLERLPPLHKGGLGGVGTVVVHDLGADELDPDDDYPQYAAAVAQAVRAHPGSFGILICGNAEGICIAANKFDGIRAGIGYSIEAARTMRNDDDANILCLPGCLPTQDDPLEIAEVFLKTPFSQAERHVRRIGQIDELDT